MYTFLQNKKESNTKIAVLTPDIEEISYDVFFDYTDEDIPFQDLETCVIGIFSYGTLDKDIIILSDIPNNYHPKIIDVIGKIADNDWEIIIDPKIIRSLNSIVSVNTLIKKFKLTGCIKTWESKHYIVRRDERFNWIKYKIITK